MPRLFRRRRYGLKPRSKAVRRPRYYRRRLLKRNPKHGGMFVVRKVKELMTLNTTGVLGGYSVSSANNTLSLGTPQAAPGGSSIYDCPFTLTFRLDELENYTELTALFDQFKIVSAKIKVQSTFFASTQTSTPVPFIDYIQDYDDNTMPSISLMRQKMGVKTKYFGSKSNVTMGVRPKPAQMLYNGALATGYAVPGRSVWINTSNSDVPHYSIKGVIRNLYLPASANVSPLTWDVSIGVALKDVQ